MSSFALVRFRGIAAGAVFAFGVLRSSVGVCDTTGRDVVVVAVSHDTALDAFRLRAAIGVELGVDAVAPEDPRAPAARGTLHVEGTDGGQRLTLSYEARSKPVKRTIDLPADPESAQRAAVALAGNLARDEASELAAGLRRTPPAPPPPAPAPSPPEAVAAAGELDPASLQAALDYHAEQDRRTRLTLAWTSLGLGAVGIGTGLAMMREAPPGWGPANGTALAVTTAGALLEVTSATAFLSSTRLEDLAAYEQGGGGAAETAAAWVRAARWEHSARAVSGTLLAVVSGATLAFGAVVGADTQWVTDPGARTGMSASLLAAGALYGLLSFVALTTDGPVESALHAYEASRGLPRWHLQVDEIGVAPARGGAEATLRLAF